MTRRGIATAAVVVMATLGVGHVPAAVVPAQVRLVVPPALQPRRGPSRDRTLSGKARRRARRTTS